MNRQRTSRPPRPYDKLASQARFPKRRIVESEPIDTSELPHRKVHPNRDLAYLRWLRKQPCSIKGKFDSRTDYPHICWHPEMQGTFIPSDPAHTKKAMSGRLKDHDSGCWPLCRDAHRMSEMAMDDFDKRYEVDRFRIAGECYARFLRETDRG